MAAENAQDMEFAIEQPGPTAGHQATIKVRLIEGQDSIEVEGPESLVMHMLTEFRQREDMLAERSMVNLREASDIRARLVSGNGQSRIESAH